MAGQPLFGALGIYRFFLATCVMIGHLVIGGTHVSNHAVFIFYMVSGYVVSIALNNRYLHSRNGIKRFYINRCLRVYPLYWIALALTALVLAFDPALNRIVDLRMYYISPFLNSSAALAWLANITLMGTADVTGNLLRPQIIPATWTVGVEMTYWIFMPLIILYKPLRHVLFLASVIYTVTLSAWDIQAAPGMPWYGMRYYNCLAGILPFLVGTYIYEYKSSRLPKSTHLLMPFIILLYAGCVAYGWQDIPHARMQGLYLSTLLGAAILYYLSHIDLKRISPLFYKVDRLLGNLAYGVLIFHQPVGALIVGHTEIAHRTFSLFYTAYPFTIAAALLGYMYVERPVESTRARFRSE